MTVKYKSSEDITEFKELICICISTGLERDKFDNKTVSFEEHIKFEHNIWHYLYFIVLVREKNKTDYTGPESYVAHMIKVHLFKIFICLDTGHILAFYCCQPKVHLCNIHSV